MTSSLTTETPTLLVFPAVENDRYHKLIDAAGIMRVVNTGDATETQSMMRHADAFFGKITPSLLASAR